MKSEYLYLIPKSPKDVGGCNFCNRVRVDIELEDVLYPYSIVFELSSDNSRQTVRFCKDCLNLLSELIREFE